MSKPDETALKKMSDATIKQTQQLKALRKKIREFVDVYADLCKSGDEYGSTMLKTFKELKAASVSIEGQREFESEMHAFSKDFETLRNAQERLKLNPISE